MNKLAKAKQNLKDALAVESGFQNYEQASRQVQRRIDRDIDKIVRQVMN